MERKDVVDDVLKNYLWFHLPKKESNLLQEYFISTCVELLEINSVGEDTENFKTNKEALNLGIIGNRKLEEKIRNRPEDNWLSEILQWKKDF